jgi:hypothetical protein
MIPPVILRAIHAWRSWRLARKRDRLMPELRDLEIRRAKCRDKHTKGARAIEAEMRRIVTERLRREVAR